MYENYLLDLERKTYHGNAFACASWSSDSTRYIDIHGNLVDILENKKIESWDDNVDFDNVKNASGNGSYLWDDDLNIPIAYINPCPIRDYGTGETLDTWCKLMTPSLDFHQKKDGTTERLMEVVMPNSVADWTFDPSGQYVLLAIWERKPGVYTDFSKFISGEFVTDTRLVLIDWRTKKSIDLARLSQFVPDYPVSSYFGSLQWSSDGSTILVPLYDSKHYLVLKVRYP